MTDSDYLAHIKARIEEIDNRMKDAQSRLDSGDVGDKSGAVNQLAHLRSQHEDLVKRFDAAKAKGAEHWSALRTSFKEEADALADTMEKWLTKF